MTVWTDIAYHNKDVIRVKNTMITFVAKNVQATSFSFKFLFSWLNKKWQSIPKNIVV